MLQRTQLRHHGHQARILAFHPDFLPHPDLLTLIREDLPRFVVFRQSCREAEALTEGDGVGGGGRGEGFAGEGIGEGGEGWWRGRVGLGELESAEDEEERGLGDGEVE